MSERTFEFSDGTSNKFWAISVSGESHTVRFGKVGTKGQSKTKPFGSAAKAQADADALIAEKTGKGYKETTTGGSAGASPVVAAAAPPPPPAPAKPKKAEAAEPSPAPAVVAPPTASADIDLSPEDYTWVTYGERPKFDPPAGGMSPAELVETLRNPGDWTVPKWHTARTPYHLADTARVSTIPRMTDAEKEEARALLRPMVAVANWPMMNHTFAPVPFMLAALLGMHAEVRAVVASWPDDYAGGRDNYSDFYKQPARMVFGLGSREEVIAQGRRLNLPLHSYEDIRGWLAHTGTEALDLVRDSILPSGNKDECEKRLREFCRVKAPAAAPFMLELMLDSKAPALAREWLLANPGSAAVGLASVAAGKGKLADAAKEFLAELKARGQTAAIRAAIAANPEAAAALQAILDHEEKTYPDLARAAMPSSLQTVFNAQPTKVSLPDWISVASLPPVLVNGAKLSEADVAAMLTGFRALKSESRPPAAHFLKQFADPKSLDAFAWAVFQAWSRAGFPSKDKWCILTLGWIGGDRSSRELTPLVREWPGQSQHQRAKVGLEVLRMIGSDLALTMLNGIAQKLKFAALKARARELMDLIATDRGMTRPELEDRIVPDLGLDAKGGRSFDFGPRQFRLVIGPDLKPAVKGPDDKVKPNLPAANSKDDADKAKAATEDWKALKKQLTDVLKLQPWRLEQAMVTMRRWQPADFDALLVRHPLMTLLVRRLVWGWYGADGKLASTFRVTDELEYADASDKPVTLAGTGSVGIVHPLNLSDADRGKWGAVFGDYEIVPPFPQLSRPVYAAEGAERTAKNIERFAEMGVHPGKIWGDTEKRGWERGSSSDHGVVQEFGKWYPAAGVTAIFEVDPGIPRGAIDLLGDEQSITKCFFVSGQYSALAYPYHKDEAKLPLGQVDPVAYSETLADLHHMTAKSG